MSKKRLISLGRRSEKEVIKEVIKIVEALDLKQYDSDLNKIVFGGEHWEAVRDRPYYDDFGYDGWGTQTYVKKDGYDYAIKTCDELNKELKKLGIKKLNIKI